MNRAFVDYYRERGISPVGQDITDLERHFQRRAALYRFLGIPPLYIQGRSVLEFGPGSGHNALYTASQSPARYVLVDGNPRGVRETRELLLSGTALSPAQCTIIESLVEDFETADTFELVLAEGLIPFQLDPAAIARKVAEFVTPNGILVVTCADGASIIGEVCRRLLAERFAGDVTGRPRRELLRRIFGPHLATLAGMSRSLDDWLDDNIDHPWIGRPFSIRDAISCLEGQGYRIYGASPHMFVDWRWYKDVVGPQAAFNQRACESYLQNVINLLDYRLTLPPQDAETGKRLLDSTDRLYDLMQASERGDSGAVTEAVTVLDDIAAQVSAFAPQTAASLREVAHALRCAVLDVKSLRNFESHFGRGQQYLSFVRDALI